MTLCEWFSEAEYRYQHSDEGRRAARMDGWEEDAELTDEEWWAKHGRP